MIDAKFKRLIFHSDKPSSKTILKMFAKCIEMHTLSTLFSTMDFFIET